MATNLENNSAKIKICGLSRPVDIDYVNEAKPDYCGFIINVPKSIRNTTPEQVRALRAKLSTDIVPVGVFRNAPVEQVAELLLDGTIGVAQLHGSEDEDYIRKLRTYGTFTIFKAFRVPSGEEIGDAMEARPLEDTKAGSAADEEKERKASHLNGALRDWADAVNASSADLVLLDNGGGGTGKTFEWALADLIRRPFLLAGGIGPDNLTDALDRLHPWGVDMSSSVETDGKKDREKILAAVAKVRKWNQKI
ncbi:MAG: phosphoribosylanthranilate isomerase [Lachnospiraceae bacterium]|nr:phosphoribosylanthranilate isomerase [Lachnospiraceae bacterium]